MTPLCFCIHCVQPTTVLPFGLGQRGAGGGGAGALIDPEQYVHQQCTWQIHLECCPPHGFREADMLAGTVGATARHEAIS